MKNFLLNHVYQFRSELGISQEELAEKLGVTCQTVVSLENGDYVPSIALALKIAGFFERPMEEIFQFQHGKK